MSRLKRKQPGGEEVSAADKADAIMYLAATQLMDKSVQFLPWEERVPYFQAVSARKIHEELHDLSNPTRKLAHLIGAGGFETIKSMAERWRQTHPKVE